MLSVLSKLPQLLAEDAMIRDLLSVTPFVDTNSGTLQPPSALHDPRCYPFPPC